MTGRPTRNATTRNAFLAFLAAAVVLVVAGLGHPGALPGNGSWTIGSSAFAQLRAQQDGDLARPPAPQLSGFQQAGHSTASAVQRAAHEPQPGGVAVLATVLLLLASASLRRRASRATATSSTTHGRSTRGPPGTFSAPV